MEENPEFSDYIDNLILQEKVTSINIKYTLIYFLPKP